MLATHVLRHLSWTPPALLVAYVVYLRAAPRERRRGLFDWMLVLVAGGLYFYIERGGNQYGPRFHYEAFLFMAVFVAANLVRGPRLEGRPRRDRLLFGFTAASVAVMPVVVRRTRGHRATSHQGADGPVRQCGRRRPRSGARAD